MQTSNAAHQSTYRKTASGFLAAGFLFGVIGPLTVAWRYEFDKDPRTIALHFLAFNATLFLAGVLSHRRLRTVSRKALLQFACLLATFGFGFLALVVPPMSSALRVLGMCVLGASAGTLLTSLLHYIRSDYERRAAATINFCSLLFGSGCLLSATLLWSMYSIRVRWQIAALSALPIFLLPLLPRGETAKVETPGGGYPHTPYSLKDLQRPAVILFGLLLFFQFGNESALAAWLPLFLIHRLGLNPQTAILLLGLYFLSIIMGRAISHLTIARLNHGRLLFASTAAAMFGYLLLSFTDSTFGAALATIVTGLGFAPVYALVAERIGHRFDYEPGFFNAIFSVAIAGGMLIPWILGFAGYYLGMQYVLLIPALSTIFVLVLVLLIMLEATVLRGDPNSSSQKPAVRSNAAATGGGRP